MTYTLKSNATTATAVVVFVGENGVINLVGGGPSIGTTGTMSSSTQNGHTVYGSGAALTNNFTVALNSISASTAFSVLEVFKPTSTLVDDRTIVNDGVRNYGVQYSPNRMTHGSSFQGGEALQPLTGYSHPPSDLVTMIWGRRSDGKKAQYYNGSGTASALNDSSATVAAGTWKFGGSHSGTTVGAGVGIFAVFVGTGPDTLSAYLGSDAYAAMFDTAVVSDLTGNVTLDAAVAAGAGGSSASDLGGNVTLSAAAAAGDLGVQPGTVTTAPWRAPVTGAVLASTTIPKLAILRISDMANVLTLTDQTTNGAGVLTITNAALLQGVPYLLVACNADGTAFGAEAYTST